MTNEELANIIDNDPVAYKAFYVEFFRKLFNYGKKFTVHISYIEDAIQEVFLDLWTNKHKLKQINSVNSYLFSSFRYILLKRLKFENRIVSSETLDAEPEFSAEHELISNEIDREMRARLNNALDTLTPRQREAIFLRIYQNLSYDELAVVLNISVKATYKIMARSLTALKDQMQDYLVLLLVILS